MGLLARVLGESEPTNILGMTSSVRMDRDVARERDRECSVRAAQAQVREAEVLGRLHTVRVGVLAVDSINAIAEGAAARSPYNRHRTDAVADAGTAAILQIVAT